MLENCIFHIDVNSAYLSWSALDWLGKGESIDLREVPSIIGGDMEQRHGVVLAKSLLAKKYGITTGEPIVNALRKCPDLLIVPPNHSLYEERSQEFTNYLYQLCPDIEKTSIDECYLYYSPISGNYESPEAAAGIIKDGVREKLGFTVNIGISDKKILAKMASDFKKPDLVHTLYTHEIQRKMWPLPVSSLYMCGKSSTEILRNLEIRTIGELASTNPDILFSHLKSHGVLLWEYANGIDPSPVISQPQEAKGIGNSTTLARDVSDSKEAYHILLALSDSVSARLREAGQLAGMVSTEIKYNTFQKVSHQTTLSIPVNNTQTIYKTACKLFDEVWNQTPIRLLGIRTSRLVSEEEPVQLSFEDMIAESKQGTEAKQKTLDQTLDKIRKKYGEHSVMRGSFLYEESEER